jgi:hypothetical protein
LRAREQSEVQEREQAANVPGGGARTRTLQLRLQLRADRLVVGAQLRDARQLR